MTAALRYSLIVRHPDTDVPTPLLAGTSVPAWATGLVHDDDLVEAADRTVEVVETTTIETVTNTPSEPDTDPDNEVPYSSMTKKQLEAEVKIRNAERDVEDVDYIVVDAPGNKTELVAALEADDEAGDPAEG